MNFLLKVMLWVLDLPYSINGKLRTLFRILYIFINVIIFSGAFIFTAEIFITETSSVKEILFGGAIMLILLKYFMGEVFATLKQMGNDDT